MANRSAGSRYKGRVTPVGSRKVVRWDAVNEVGGGAGAARSQTRAAARVATIAAHASRSRVMPNRGALANVPRDGVAADPDSAVSANATSRAVWKRWSGGFSKQW